MTITLHLSDEQLARLKRSAEAAGVTAEEYAVRVLTADDAFRRAAEATFAEHAEAYRRLAK